MWARDDVNRIRDQGAVVRQLNEIITNLTATFRVYDDALKHVMIANFPDDSPFYQAPLQYCLVAAKPGEIVPTPHGSSRAEILSDILACPHEKKPIRWDGVSDFVCAAGAQRRYPVKGGVPYFM